MASLRVLKYSIHQQCHRHHLTCIRFVIYCWLNVFCWCFSSSSSFEHTASEIHATKNEELRFCLGMYGMHSMQTIYGTNLWAKRKKWRSEHWQRIIVFSCIQYSEHTWYTRYYNMCMFTSTAHFMHSMCL